MTCLQRDTAWVDDPLLFHMPLYMPLLIMSGCVWIAVDVLVKHILRHREEPLCRNLRPDIRLIAYSILPADFARVVLGAISMPWNCMPHARIKGTKE